MKTTDHKPTDSYELANRDGAAETPESGDPIAATQNPAQPTLDLPDDAINLVPILLKAGEGDPDVKKFINHDVADQVVKHFNEDWESRRAWMDKVKELWTLFLGHLKPKSSPWKDCANLHDPIILTRILRLVSRVWGEIFTQGQPLFTAVSNSSLNDERADTITKHENHQFRKEIPSFPSQMFEALISFFLPGEAITKSYRDFDVGVNRHDYVRHSEFVYPYTRHAKEPDMSDVPRKTHILFQHKRDLLKMQKMGFYAQVDEVVKTDSSFDTGLDEVLKDAIASFEGQDRKDTTCDAPYWLLEQHTWLKFPYRDEEEPVRIVVDGKSGKVLGLYSRYYDDPDDRVRYDREMAEFQAYGQSIQEYTAAMQQFIPLEQQLLVRLDQPDVPDDERLTLAQQVQAERPAPPTRPQWMQSDEEGAPLPPEPCKKKIIEQFARAVCIDNPEGSHGIGLGWAMLNHQMAANIMLNQFVDKATLDNSDGGVCHENVQFPSGSTTTSPNEWVKVRGISADQVSKAFYKFDHGPANPQLLLGVQAQEQAADEISSAPSVLSGTKEGDETFRGQATRVEQATKQLSTLSSKFMVLMTQIAKNNAMLNFQFLPDSKKLDVQDPASGRMSSIEVSRELYRDTYDILFSADLSFASRATKVAECDDAMGLLVKGFPPQLLPQVFKLEGVGLALRKCLQARGMHDLAAYVMSNKEIGQAIMQQQLAAQATPPGAPKPPGPPGMPPPSIPSGQPNPGQPQQQIAAGTPREVGPNVQ